MLSEQEYVIVDLETTGGHVLEDRITEVALIEMSGTQEVRRWSSLINPGRPISAFIEQLTGIGDHMVADAPVFADVADEIWQRLHGKLLVAHNARCDYNFLRNEFRRLEGRGSFQARTLCTVRLSGRLYPEDKRHGLDRVIERHGIQIENRHRAMGDAEALKAFVLDVVEKIEPARLSAEVAHLVKQQILPSHLAAELSGELPEVTGVYWFLDDRENVIHVARHRNIRAGVLSDLRMFQGRHKRVTPSVQQVKWQETVGELGAALLETCLLRQPRFAGARRRGLAQRICSWRFVTDSRGAYCPEIVYADQVDFMQHDDLYGVFLSPAEAKRALAAWWRAAGLKTASGALMIEAAQVSHVFRVIAPHRIVEWPFSGAISIEERDPLTGACVSYSFDLWRLVGVHGDYEQAFKPERIAATGFDAYVYRVLQHYFQQPYTHTYVVTPLCA